MKEIEESDNKEKWPRKKCSQVSTRKRDLVVRIADWTKEKDEPAYDVELYIGGIYDWNESKTFSTRSYGSKEKAKAEAITFAQAQIQKLL